MRHRKAALRPKGRVESFKPFFGDRQIWYDLFQYETKGRWIDLKKEAYKVESLRYFVLPFFITNHWALSLNKTTETFRSLG